MFLGIFTFSVADPGFPVGGANLVGGGAPTPEAATFEKFVCENKRMWTLEGGAHASGAPWIRQWFCTHFL